MRKASEILLHRFYQEFWIFLSLLILMIVLVLFLTLFFLIRIRSMAKIYKLLIPIADVLLLVFAIAFGRYFSKYYDDYMYLKSNDPIEIEGKVTGYLSSVSGDELTVTNSWPSILILESKKVITLNIINSEMKIKENEVYIFLYLPNTKIAEVVE